MWTQWCSGAPTALLHARGQPAGSCWCRHWALLHRSVFLTTHQLPQLGWHTSPGVLKARQLSFQGGNGSMSFCSLAALQEERASSYLLDRATCVNKHLYIFIFLNLFQRLFLESGRLWVRNNTKSVLLMIPQVLLGGSTERRQDLMSFYFILEALWGIQKACGSPKTNRERKEKNPQRKKSNFIWAPPKRVCQQHSTAHWDDISSAILWLSELHKLLPVSRTLRGTYLVHLYPLAFFSLFTLPNFLLSLTIPIVTSQISRLTY